MKRICLSIALCLLASMSFAQKKAIKDAKTSMDAKNYPEAREFIKHAMADPETANDPETYKVAGDIENKALDEERAKQVLGQAFNEETMAKGALYSYDPYVKADSLAQIPNEKGKIKNKYRKDIAVIMSANLPYLGNAGSFFYNKQDYKQAGECFEKYWNMPSLPMFSESKEKVVANDTVYQIIKYYAVNCALLNKNDAHAIDLMNRIKSEKFTPNTVYTEEKVYELIAQQHLNMGDTITYNKLLAEGAKQFPKNNFFLTNLINVYISNGQSAEALSYLDKAIANDPSNTCDYSATKGQIYAKTENFEQSEASYNEALNKDPKCEKALEGLAVSYIIQGQKFNDKAGELKAGKEQTELTQKANATFAKAYPLLENYKKILVDRKADESDMKRVLIKLRFVYNQLKMNTEYEATEKELSAVQ